MARTYIRLTASYEGISDFERDLCRKYKMLIEMWKKENEEKMVKENSPTRLASWPRSVRGPGSLLRCAAHVHPPTRPIRNRALTQKDVRGRAEGNRKMSIVMISTRWHNRDRELYSVPLELNSIASITAANDDVCSLFPFNRCACRCRSPSSSIT